MPGTPESPGPPGGRLLADADLVEEHIEGGMQLEVRHLLQAGGVLQGMVDEDPRCIIGYDLLHLAVKLSALLEANGARRPIKDLVHSGVLIVATVEPVGRQRASVEDQAEH